MAAISKMISVTSWSASHTNCRNVLAFLGGMKFWPKTCRLFSRSVGFPDRPGEVRDGDDRKPHHCPPPAPVGPPQGAAPCLHRGTRGSKEKPRQGFAHVTHGAGDIQPVGQDTAGATGRRARRGQGEHVEPPLPSAAASQSARVPVNASWHWPACLHAASN